MNQLHITYMGSGVNNFNFLNLECEIRFLIDRLFYRQVLFVLLFDR